MYYPYPWLPVTTNSTSILNGTNITNMANMANMANRTRISHDAAHIEVYTAGCALSGASPICL